MDSTAATTYSIIPARVIVNDTFYLKGNSIFNNKNGGKIIINEVAPSFEGFNMENSSSVLNNEAGGTIEINNGGNFQLIGGLLNNYGTVTNKAGGRITNSNGLFGMQFINQAGGVFYNHGSIDGAMTFTNQGLMENSGTINGAIINNSSTLTLTNTATGTITNSWINNAGIIVNYGSISGSYGNYINNGTFTNYGIINDMTNNQTLINYGEMSREGDIRNNATLINNGTIYDPENGWYASLSGYVQSTDTLINNGTLYNFWTFADITNTASGVIDVTSRADHYSGVLTNNGTFINRGRYWCLYDLSTDNADPAFWYKATFINNASFTNMAGATFEIMGGGTLRNNGLLYNYGTIDSKRWNPGSHNQLPGTTENSGAIYNYGTIYNSDGSTFTSSGGLYNYGAFYNNGGSTLNVTGGTVYGAITNYGTFNVSGGTFILPTTGQSITNLSGRADFRASTVTGSPLVTVTDSAAGSHTFSFTGGSAVNGTVKVVDLPGGSTASFTGGGDVGAYYYDLAAARLSAWTPRITI